MKRIVLHQWRIDDRQSLVDDRQKALSAHLPVPRTALFPEQGQFGDLPFVVIITTPDLLG